MHHSNQHLTLSIVCIYKSLRHIMLIRIKSRTFHCRDKCPNVYPFPERMHQLEHNERIGLLNVVNSRSFTLPIVGWAAESVIANFLAVIKEKEPIFVNWDKRVQVQEVGYPEAQ